MPGLRCLNPVIFQTWLTIRKWTAHMPVLNTTNVIAAAERKSSRGQTANRIVQQKGCSGSWKSCSSSHRRSCCHPVRLATLQNSPPATKFIFLECIFQQPASYVHYPNNPESSFITMIKNFEPFGWVANRSERGYCGLQPESFSTAALFLFISHS